MPSIGEAVHRYLQTLTSVTNLAGTRGYPGNLPRNRTLPAYVYNVISSAEEQHIGGIHGISEARVQIDAYANDHDSAWKLRDAIRLGLLAGVTGGTTLDMAGVIVDRVIREDGDTVTIEPKNASDLWLHRHRDDYRIMHDEAT